MKVFAILCFILCIFANTAFAQNAQNNNPVPDAYKQAREILGNDLITPKDVENVFSDVSYAKYQLDYFKEHIPNEDNLRYAKENGYVLIPGPSEIRNLSAITYTKGDSLTPADVVKPIWYMIKKTAFPGSQNKNWFVQKNMLPNLQYVPNISQMSWFVGVYLKIRGEKLFTETYVRTSTTFEFTEFEPLPGPVSWTIGVDEKKKNGNIELRRRSHMFLEHNLGIAAGVVLSGEEL